VEGGRRVSFYYPRNGTCSEVLFPNVSSNSSFFLCRKKFYRNLFTIRVSEWLLFNTNSAIFSAISWQKQVNFQWDDEKVHFVLNQHA
jgi:hypothetical protein